MQSLFDAVGNTPLINLNRIGSNRNLFGKAEFLNPTGSVKDRAAARMLGDALRSESGSSKKKQILDSSSGNTGISLAALGASLGYGITVIIPKSASEERQKMLRLYGAHIIYSDPLEGSDGAILIARKLANDKPDQYIFVDQYSNDANWQSHYYGTAEEIWKQTDGKITHFVAGVGTGGTVMGTGRRLKEKNSQIRIIAVQPSSPIHGIEGLKHIQSSIKPRIFDERFPDITEFVETEEAQRAVKVLASQQGVLVGTSSGASVTVAKKYAEESEKNSVVAILADGGSRYLSEKYLNSP